MTYYTIYKIINKINGKYYCGKHQTKDLDDGYMGSGKLIKQAIKKYGIENFYKEIMFVCETEEEMNLKEKEVVVVSEETYNLCEGGKGGFSYINKLPRSEKQRQAARNLAYNQNLPKLNSPEYRWVKIKGGKAAAKNLHEKYPNGPFFGRKHSEVSLAKIRTAMSGCGKGVKNSQYGTCWITNGDNNKKIKMKDLDKWIEQGYYRGRV